MKIKHKRRSRPSNLRTRKPPERAAPGAARAVLWPRDLQARYGVSAPTIWRWERDGRLPPRDKAVGDRIGWAVQTIVAAESRAAPPAPVLTSELHP